MCETAVPGQGHARLPAAKEGRRFRGFEILRPKGLVCPHALPQESRSQPGMRCSIHPSIHLPLYLVISYIHPSIYLSTQPFVHIHSLIHAFHIYIHPCTHSSITHSISIYLSLPTHPPTHPLIHSSTWYHSALLQAAKQLLETEPGEGRGHGCHQGGRRETREPIRNGDQKWRNISQWDRKNKEDKEKMLRAKLAWGMDPDPDAILLAVKQLPICGRRDTWNPICLGPGRISQVLGARTLGAIISLSTLRWASQVQSGRPNRAAAVVKCSSGSPLLAPGRVEPIQICSPASQRQEASASKVSLASLRRPLQADTSHYPKVYSSHFSK